MSMQEGVVAMAALRLASGATDEEWPQVMKILTGKKVPLTADEVVDQLRAALSQVRSKAANR
jgi:hypothetical protein